MPDRIVPEFWKPESRFRLGNVMIGLAVALVCVASAAGICWLVDQAFTVVAK